LATCWNLLPKCGNFKKKSTLGSIDFERNPKKHRMLVITIQNQISIYVLPFETMVIMENCSFYYSCEYYRIPIKNPFDPILGFDFSC
jgi:hypothetical protein